jgi:hypothetical protein
MGLLDTILDPSGITRGEFSITDTMDPGGAIVSELTGSDIARDIAMPFGAEEQIEDLWASFSGEQAEEDRAAISAILEESAASGIAAQEEQRARIKEMYAPYYESAVSGGLPQLQAMAEGGEIDYTPSRLYEYSKERGERNIRRIQASKGQLESSATEERLSDFRLGLAEEEMDRLYAGQLSRTQLGSGAADAVGAASRALGGNVGALYSNLGAGLNVAQQGYGQSRQSAYDGLAGALSGLSRYMEAS